jgi:transposase
MFFKMNTKTRLSRELIRIKIQTLNKEGYGTMQIARKLNIHKNIVIRWKKRKIVRDEKRSGRPTKLSSVTKRQIKAKMYRIIGSSTRKTAKYLNESFQYKSKGKTISHTTIQNYLKSTSWGRNAFKSKKQPLLSYTGVFTQSAQ